MLGRCIDALPSKPGSAQANREQAATHIWRTRLTTAGVLVDAELQDALRIYDRARAHSVECINQAIIDDAQQSYEQLEQARVGILNALNAERNELNAALAPHINSFWQRMRGKRPPFSGPFPTQTALGSSRTTESGP